MEKPFPSERGADTDLARSDRDGDGTIRSVRVHDPTQHDGETVPISFFSLHDFQNILIYFVRLS